MTFQEKILVAIKLGREVTFSDSENIEGGVACLIYSRSKGGVSGDALTLEEAFELAMKKVLTIKVKL